MRVAMSPREKQRGLPFKTSLIQLYFLAVHLLSSASGELVVDGDLNLAFLASIRVFDPLIESCGSVKSEGAKLAEAAVFIAETVNEELLGDTPIRLGLDVLDTCPGIADAVLRLSAPHIPPERKCRQEYELQHHKTLGVIGLDTYREVGEFSGFAEKFALPVLTYAASNPALALKAAYPFLLRTVPCDCGLYGHMASFIASQRPKSVGILYEDNLYGQRSRELLEGGLKTRGYRSYFHQKLSNPIRDSDLMSAVQTLQRTPGVTTVAIVLRDENIPKFVNCMDRMNLYDLTNLVLPSGFARFVNVTNAAKFSRMTIVKHRTEEMPRILEYLRTQCRSGSGGRTHWGKEHNAFHMGFPGDCDKIEGDPRFKFIADAFFSYAHAVKKFTSEYCSTIPRWKCIDELGSCFGREKIRENLSAVKFNPMDAGNETFFEFNRKGDAILAFDMVQPHRNWNNSLSWTKIGG